MNTSAEQAIERVIAKIHDNLGDQVTVDDMAKAAMFSKFHFTRMFERATGVSPRRFLSAVRIQRAKHLLVSTPLTVADICFEVGYNSVGTFSSRFTRSVGLSPTAYRKMGGFATHIPVHGHSAGADDESRCVVQGSIRPLWPDQAGLVFAGLFPQRIPEGPPVRCTVLHRAGSFCFEDVPEGDWYLLAHSVAAQTQDLVRHTFARNRALSVGSLGPLKVRPGAGVPSVDLELQPMSLLDPPVLLALLDVRTVALNTIGRVEADRPDALDPDTLDPDTLDTEELDTEELDTEELDRELAVMQADDMDDVYAQQAA